MTADPAQGYAESLAAQAAGLASRVDQLEDADRRRTRQLSAIAAQIQSIKREMSQLRLEATR